MGVAFLHGNGGGGAGLNFKVVGGPSQRTKPESPSLNMIWVDTEVDISSWTISIARPTDPEPGMVWISTGKFNNYLFNALKKNSIQINPNGIYQYVDDAWVDVNAEIYNGEAWSPMKFDLWLIKDGVYNTDDFGTFSSPGSIQNNNSGILITRYATYITDPTKLIDFSKYAAMAYTVTYHAYGGIQVTFRDKSKASVCQFQLTLSPPDQYSDPHDFTVDISMYADKLSGVPCYIEFYGLGNNDSNMNKLNNIRFIPA